MPANAYPHLVFATDADTLPRTELEPLVRELFSELDPAPTVEQGPLQAIVRLGEYAFTFWYDDDSEGLGGRYADYAPALNRRRISRCTTMIDLSGDADPDAGHAEDARRLTEALAAHPGVYVFSETAKAFVGLDTTDPFADALAPTTGTPQEPATAPDPVVAPEPVATSEPEPAATAEPQDIEPDTLSAVQPEPAETESIEAEPIEAEPIEAEPIEAEPIEAEQAEVVQPELEPAVEPEQAPEPEPHPEAEPQPEPEAEPEPARQEGGFFKKLFGRRR